MNLFFSFGPEPPGADAFPAADKVLHAGAYAVTMGVFLMVAVWRPGRGSGRYPRALPLIIGVALTLSVGSELLQGTVFERDADLLDASADLAGVMLALGVWRILRRLAVSD